jgi:hypothetical protein
MVLRYLSTIKLKLNCQLTKFKNTYTKIFVEKFASTKIVVYICTTKYFVMQRCDIKNRL